MPIYVYKCKSCGLEQEVLLNKGVEILSCRQCGGMALKCPTFPALVKMKGEGGLPSRRKFVQGSAPYTSRDVKPWLDSDPSEKNWLSRDARRREEERLEISKPSSL
jgi:putative FmdB family regulatory protein